MGNKLSHKYRPSKQEKAWNIPETSSVSSQEESGKKSEKKKKQKKSKSKHKENGKAGLKGKSPKSKQNLNEDEHVQSYNHPKIIITSPSDVEASFDDTPKKDATGGGASANMQMSGDVHSSAGSDRNEVRGGRIETIQEKSGLEEIEAENASKEVQAAAPEQDTSLSGIDHEIIEVNVVGSDDTEPAIELHNDIEPTCKEPHIETASKETPIETTSKETPIEPTLKESPIESVCKETPIETTPKETPNKETPIKTTCKEPYIEPTCNEPTNEPVFPSEAPPCPPPHTVEAICTGTRTDLQVDSETPAKDDEKISPVEANIVSAVMPNSDVIWMEEIARKPETGNTVTETITIKDIANEIVSKAETEGVKEYRNIQNEDENTTVTDSNTVNAFEPSIVESGCIGVRTDLLAQCNEPSIESNVDVGNDKAGVITVELEDSTTICLEELNTECGPVDKQDTNEGNEKGGEINAVQNENNSTAEVSLEEISPGVIANTLIQRADSSSSVDEGLTSEGRQIHQQETNMLQEQQEWEKEEWEKEERKRKEQLKRIRDVEEKENIQKPSLNGSYKENELNFNFPTPKSAPPVASKPKYQQLSNTPSSLANIETPPSSAPPVVQNVERMSFRDRRKYFEQEIRHQSDETGSTKRKKISLVSDQDLRTIKQEEEKKYGTLSKDDIRKSMNIDEEDEDIIDEMSDISSRVDQNSSVLIEGKEYKVEKRPQKLSARERLTPQYSTPVSASSEEDLIRSLEKDVRASCIEDSDPPSSTGLSERLSLTSPDVKHDVTRGHDLSPAERRALEAEKRKQWRQARFKSLEADALQAQVVMTKEKMKGRRSEGSFNDKQPTMT